MTPEHIWIEINITQLSQALKISRNSIYKWRAKGVIPAERVVRAELGLEAHGGERRAARGARRAARVEEAVRDDAPARRDDARDRARELILH